jgi:methyltransferase
MTVWGAYAAHVLAFTIMRITELRLSSRNLARLRARGAREAAAGHFPWIVLLHVSYPVLLAWEIAAGARPRPEWPLWLAVWLGAQVLRWVSIHALGERWNTRIVVLPGEARVRSGIYGWFPHPNYVAVVLEFIAAPLAFGAWRTALFCSAANAMLMAIRIPAEERALREAENG